MTDDLPTARSTAPTRFRVHVWCMPIFVDVDRVDPQRQGRHPALAAEVAVRELLLPAHRHGYDRAHLRRTTPISARSVLSEVEPHTNIRRELVGVPGIDQVSTSR